VDPRTLHQRRDEFQVLDVREDREWLAGRIEEALHIPLGDLPGRLGELDRTRPVVAVCRSGNRSGRAAEFLARAGISAHNLEGGLKRWTKAGLPITTPDGRPGRVV
jgi:rhodanese-related sulfurtransferase